MKRFRIRTLMGLVVVLGVVLALVARPTPIGNAMAFTASVFAVLVAAIGAMAGRGRVRARCLGFVTLGGGYLVLSLGPWFGEHVAPHLVTSMLIDWLHERLGLGGTGLGETWEILDGASVTVFTGPSPPGRSGPEFARLLHSILAIVFGILGAIIADRFARQDPPGPVGRPPDEASA